MAYDEYNKIFNRAVLEVSRMYPSCAGISGLVSSMTGYECASAANGMASDALRKGLCAGLELNLATKD